MDSHKTSHILLKLGSFAIKEDVDKYKTIEIPICKSKGGEVYLFDLPTEKKGILCS